jgi:hypothetical protein
MDRLGLETNPTSRDTKIIVWVPLIKTTMEIKEKDFNPLIFIRL